LSRGHRPACLTTALASSKRAGSPVSARIAAAPTTDTPRMLVTSSARPSSASALAMWPSTSASAASACLKSASTSALRSSAPARWDVTHGLAGGGIQRPQDAQVASPPTPAGQLAGDRPGKAGQAQPADACRVAAADRHRGPPGQAVKAMPRHLQRRRPAALQQVPQALLGGGRQDALLDPPVAEMTKPRPGRGGPLGQLAVQLGREPGDQKGVLSSLLSWVKSSASRARPTSSGCTQTTSSPSLWACSTTPASGARSAHRPPPRRRSPTDTPRPAPTPTPCRAARGGTARSGGQHPRVVVAHHHHLGVVGQVNRQHRTVTADHPTQALQAGVTT
jgi:hypothetical protein